jgi:hypothetical protein
MTTIAYKDGIMACDSCWSENKAVDTLQTKIERLPSGALLGSAGDNDNRQMKRLFVNVKTPAALPDKAAILAIRCEYAGILVLPKGRVFKISATHMSEAHWGADFADDVGLWEISGPFCAIGTGKEFALGAMAAGKDAVEAVRIACRFDINSRPPVHQVALKRSAK